MQQAALVRGGEHGNRVGRPGRAQVGALERIDGDVHLRETAGRAAAERVRHADSLADVEHRRIVAFAFADDDGAVDRDGVHDLAHRLDGDLIGLVTVALPHGVGARDRRLLDDAQEFERKIRVHLRLHIGSMRR